MSLPGSAEIVVVGGGPAGASAACLLAAAGRRPLVIERETEPRHKICGEFLSVEAQGYLAALGIDPRALGGAEIDRVRLVAGARVAEAPLPFRGVGLSRRVLDEALLLRAEAVGAQVIRGVVAREIEAEEGGLRVDLGRDGAIAAATVFHASGKHDLRNPKRPREGCDLIGFKTYFALRPRERAALEGIIEVILFEGGYAGFQLVEEGQANLCLLVRQSAYEAVGRSFEALLARLMAECPELARRLADATPLLDKPLAIAQVPYGFVYAPEPGAPEGLFRLGDQMGVIPSFSGDGMSIALHTARLAAGTYLRRGNAAGRYHAEARRDIERQIRLASNLYAVSRSPLGQQALVLACRTVPAALRLMAAWTRVPDAALERAGLGLR
ncbi:MAG TPA: FAD-dependent monooxygenase [Microvirga sp.]|jgi:flavin-dependent dehydrogenase